MTQIRPLVIEDCQNLQNIYAVCFENGYKTANKTLWTKETFEGFFYNTEATILIGFCVFDGFDPQQIKGFIIGRTIGDCNDILTFAVLPNFQNQGIGKNLLKFYLYELRREKSQTSCILEVSIKNTHAIGLYESFGFKTIHKRPNYYKVGYNSYEDALIMKN